MDAKETNSFTSKTRLSDIASSCSLIPSDTDVAGGQSQATTPTNPAALRKLYVE